MLREIWISNKISALAFATLYEAQEVTLECPQLKVGGTVGDKGLKRLVKAMQGRTAHYIDVSISKEALAAARLEDIKIVVWKFSGNLEVFNKEDKLPVDQGWIFFVISV